MALPLGWGQIRALGVFWKPCRKGAERVSAFVPAAGTEAGLGAPAGAGTGGWPHREGQLAQGGARAGGEAGALGLTRGVGQAAAACGCGREINEES